jgi:hypothetical protein
MVSYTINVSHMMPSAKRANRRQRARENHPAEQFAVGHA